MLCLVPVGMGKGESTGGMAYQNLNYSRILENQIDLVCTLI